MALAVFRFCVMSRITNGVTRKLKEAATCRKKPGYVYNRSDDLNLMEWDDYWNCPRGHVEGLYDDEYRRSVEEFNDLYASEPFASCVDEQERRERVLDHMFYWSI
ncbi:PREDICTED: uncharacterized protein LOC104716720 [Camelina sativa]|uniref:Uncharacterized protein LOC104716720 n=1 Tax=Camelina sativa TaxID=90675 RepID=A0ABM0TWD7_CAMSA|nr:PREDICTED: uncharacterized protein LOC104716720 [Camelina sativa]